MHFYFFLGCQCCLKPDTCGKDVSGQQVVLEGMDAAINEDAVNVDDELENNEGDKYLMTKNKSLRLLDNLRQNMECLMAHLSYVVGWGNHHRKRESYFVSIWCNCSCQDETWYLGCLIHLCVL